MGIEKEKKKEQDEGRLEARDYAMACQYIEISRTFKH